jgi:FG-GAP repeat
MEKRKAFTIFVLYLVVLLLSACASSATGTAGVLELTIGGLIGVDASVTVTGPNSFNQSVKTSSKLENLATGDYTITAQDVVQTDTYFPDKREQNVVVKAGETTSVTLVYSKQNPNAGSLEVAINGLPSGTNADVTIAGANGFSQLVTTSSVLSNLPPGDYQLTANAVTVGSDTYTPTPTSQTIGIVAGGKADFTVTYAKQTATVGQLAITVKGIPTDLTATATVTGPSGFSEALEASKTFSNLSPGEYTVTASKLDGTYPYNPYPKTQKVTVVAGESANALLGYVPTIPLPHTSVDGAFGSAVAVDGDVLVIGAPEETSGNVPHSGFAYIYQRSLVGEWQFVKQLAPPMGDANDHFGSSVAVSGDTIVVGAPDALTGTCTVVTCTKAGAAYVFKRNDDKNFVYAYTLQPSSAFNPLSDDDQFGASVAVSDNGNVIVVGVPGLANDVNGDNTLACDGNTKFEECYVGGAYLFYSDTTTSGQKLLLSEDKHGSDGFGASVALSGDTLVVGAERDSYDIDKDGTEECGGMTTDNSECFIGSAYLFERNEGSPNAWGQVTKLFPSSYQIDDQFGASVAIDADTVVVGTRNSDGGQDKALAFIFERNQGGINTWAEVKKLSTGGMFEGFDASNVAVKGDVVVMAVPFMNSDVNGDGSVDCQPPARGTGEECLTGAALVYQRNAGGANNFGLVQNFVTSDGMRDDFLGGGFSGNGVSISDKSIILGAPGHATVGAVYIFTP